MFTEMQLMGLVSLAIWLIATIVAPSTSSKLFMSWAICYTPLTAAATITGSFLLESGWGIWEASIVIPLAMFLSLLGALLAEEKPLFAFRPIH